MSQSDWSKGEFVILEAKTKRKGLTGGHRGAGAGGYAGWRQEAMVIVVWAGLALNSAF